MATAEHENLPAVKHDDRPELVMRPLMAMDLDHPDQVGYVTNIGKAGREMAVFLTNAMAKPTMTLDDLCTKPFPAAYYVAHVVPFMAEGGEIVNLPRLMLVSKRGDIAAFTSEGAIKSMDMIRSLVGDGPWEPELMLSAVPIKTRQGRRTYRLVLGANTDEAQDVEVRDSVRESFQQDTHGEPADNAGRSGGGKKR